MTKKKRKIKNVAFGVSAAAAAAGIGAVLNNDKDNDEEYFETADETKVEEESLSQEKKVEVIVQKQQGVSQEKNEKDNLKSVQTDITLETIKSKLMSFNSNIQNI